MIIKITNLPVGIHALNFEKTAKQLQLGEPFVDNVYLDCTLDKSQHQILVNCNLTIFADLICDRCSSEFKEKLKANFPLLFLYDRKNIDIVHDNLNYISPNTDKIDLTEDIIDYSKLSIPMKKLCSEDCKGLCIKCGINLNEKKCNCEDNEDNTVWTPLSKLKDKLK